MSNQYQYSLLQYHHLRREEWLTLGVLVLFPEYKQLRFLYPRKLRRLKEAFPDAPDKLLHAWLTGFSSQAKVLNERPEIFSNHHLEHHSQSLIDAYFLPTDNSALQFSAVKTSVQYTEDINTICNNLSAVFLDVYNSGLEDYVQKDDAWLANQYKKFLREKDGENQRRDNIKENYIAQYRDRTYKFDFAWQNHTFNLVKPLSFDLRREDSIQRKGEQYYGQLSLLEDYARDNNIRFDLLVAPPEWPKLFKTYERAIEDIRLNKHVEIIEVGQLSSYAARTLDEIITD